MNEFVVLVTALTCVLPSLAFPALYIAGDVKNESKMIEVGDMTKNYEKPRMEELLQSNPVYLRDTVSNNMIAFDLPRGATGFYPVILPEINGNTSFVFINSSVTIHLAFVKCGRTMSLGKSRKGYVHYETKGLRALEHLDCGYKFRSEHLKLVISTDKRRARGFAKIDGKYLKPEFSANSLEMAFLGIVIAVVFLLTCCCCHCFPPKLFKAKCGHTCRKQKTTGGANWSPSGSFQYRPAFHDYPKGFFPRYRSISQVTIFEHERQEMMEMNCRQREENDDDVTDFTVGTSFE